ncbi:MAG: transcription antitermination factor NusB [Peptococcaceae bacterium]|nr:transcription antitermination factor NusB [Peptococcaceae bacterium]
MSRSAARKTALQMIFQMDVGKNEWEMALHTLEEKDLAEEDAAFALHLAEGVQKKQAEIDPYIQKESTQWSIDRMANVDKSILRLAVYELMAYPDTAKNIIINEAIELAKTFSTAESGAFVNGVLDKIAKDLSEEKIG